MKSACDTRRRFKWTIRSIRLLAWSSIAAICGTWAGVCYDYPDNPSDAGGAMPDSPAQVNQANADRVSAEQLEAGESRVVSLVQRGSLRGSPTLASHPDSGASVVPHNRVEEIKLLIIYVYLLCLVVMGSATVRWTAARAGYQIYRQRFR
jgi:hypothetical protein